MRKIIIIWLLFAAFGGKAQEKEHLNLFTDRDCYTTGETILFNVIVPEKEHSGILEVILFNTSGKIITKVNKLVTDHHAAGYLYLPDSLKTGTYLIGTTNGVNPNTTVKEIFATNRFTGLSETTAFLKAKEIFPLAKKPINTLQIDGINAVYHVREHVQAQLRLSPELLAQIIGPLFVTVSEVNPGYNSQLFLMNTGNGRNSPEGNDGIILEGMARDLMTGVPLNNGCIILSIPDSIPTLDYFMTGEDGRFRFQIRNHFGKVPVVVQGYDILKKQLIKINLFHSDSLVRATPAFGATQIPAEMQKGIEKGIEATTLSKIFNRQELNIDNPLTNKRQDYPFYGAPTETIHPNLFIDLPNFTEITRELMIGVKFRAYNRIPTLQMMNPVTRNYFNDQPLVTLDGIPVRDLNVIKSMGSKEIRKIDIVRKERYYGDLGFSGVVGIYSVKPDYKGLAESDDLIKLDLETIQPEVSLVAPQSQKSNDPDLRKVLYWAPAIKPGESVNLDFLTSDILGTFKLTLGGKTTDGTIIGFEQTFEVK